MRRSPPIFELLRLLSLAATSTIGCGSFGDDSERYSELDRLRVLAVRSEPADLTLGQTATLDALVFEPDARDVKYEWSWCPSRADASGDYQCNISEKELAKAWETLGLSGEPPSYDLGTESEAQFTHSLAPELVAALCESLSVSDNASEQAVLACLQGLQPSVQLKVRTAKAEVTALKSLNLLTQDVPEAGRNANPTSGFDVQVRRFADKKVVSSNQSLVAGTTYVLEADFGEETSQAFTPQPMGMDEDEPLEEQKEQLVMSWFYTVGKSVPPEGGDAFGDDDRTTFVADRGDFERFLRNGWELPLTAKGDAHLVLVVRDERGGVGWTEQSFNVEEK